ncbi:AAA family ATPase [uncultured Acinetobacter sp.]|uniref:AAA family ATPase n=1 Tax=uncultured Acinetobacter sp. TaxID=165433 RepID=UPI00374A0E03
MLSGLQIENYKSIKKKVQFGVGRFNVLIGENGAGKSNFLEVLASCSAILANKFSNEFMLSRGIRVVESEDIFSCFNNVSCEKIHITTADNNAFGCIFDLSLNKNEPFSPIKTEITLLHRSLDLNKDLKLVDIKEFDQNFMKEKYEELAVETYGSKEVFYEKLKSVESMMENDNVNMDVEDIRKINNIVRYMNTVGSIQRQIFNQYYATEKSSNEYNFIIYSPELSSLRNFSSDSQIEPLGVNGEGLLKLLQIMQNHEPENFERVCKTLEIFQWVEKITVENNHNNLEQRIKIIDRFMGKEIDHRSANEGFLFVLFYATLFSSKYTPKSFAVDNIDASLNPKLCRVLIKELVKLAKENDKQAFVTTHNPAILDGLDLHDDEQRLFVVERDDEGSTQLRRVGVDDLPKPKRNGETIKLSESFMRGHLGGLPTNF